MPARVSDASIFAYTVPCLIAEGDYRIKLSQYGNQSDVSALFWIFTALLNTITWVTATVASANGTGIARSTIYIYFDEHCGCTKTGHVPAGIEISMWANGPAMTMPALATYTVLAHACNLLISQVCYLALSSSPYSHRWTADQMLFSSNFASLRRPGCVPARS